MKTLLHIQMHIGRLLQRAVEGELSAQGLHHGQGRMLNIICRHTFVTQVDLARLMDVKAATVCNMLKPLEQEGLIERKIDPVTNRAMHVSLTPEGAAVCAKVQEAWQKVESRMNSVLEKHELEAAFQTLEKIRAALGGTDPMAIEEELNKRRKK